MSLKDTIGPGQLHRMMLHFLWAVPLANLLLFMAVGLITAVAAPRWPLAPGRAPDLFLGLAGPNS
jgi:hypothetical protein